MHFSLTIRSVVCDWNDPGCGLPSHHTESSAEVPVMSIFHRFRRQPEEDLSAQQSTGVACLSQMAASATI